MRKQFKSRATSTPSTIIQQSVSETTPANTVVEFPWTSGVLTRSFDFGPHYGQRCDAVVTACQRAVESRLAAQMHRTATIAVSCHVGLRSFLSFCAELAATSASPITLKHITRDLIERFIHWMALRGDRSYSAQCTAFGHVKFVLGVLCSARLLPPRKELFPFNPYPLSERSMTGARPLSEQERERVSRALRNDLSQILTDGSALSESEQLAMLLFAICLRTGRNPTPMLDVTRDAIQPHPIRDHLHILRTVKHRARSVQRTPVSADVVLIFRKALSLSEPYVPAAPSEWQEHVWLYREGGRGLNAAGPIRLLTHWTLPCAILRFVKRHRLVDDAKCTLKLTVSRLRKTLENRLWRLSGGDPFAVARLMGHSVRVADRHYFLPTPEMERNHKFVGEALVAEWSGEKGDRTPSLQNTPVGRCRDPIEGELAPKDGQACMDFLSCFRCSSYVLVEEDADLFRLYSFYWFLVRERTRIGSSQWAKVYGWIVRLIDEQVTERFDQERAKAIRERARDRPHPFWNDAVNVEAARAL